MSIQIEINGSWQKVTKQQVLEMTARGDIQPETIIDVDGQKIPASRIRDIVFADNEHLDIVLLESDSGIVTFPMIFEVTALTGGIVKLEIYENKIIIERLGIRSFVTHGLKGGKTLYFSKISAVQFQKIGVTEGSLQFTIPDGFESRGVRFDDHTDENSIRFGGADDEIMSCVHKFIEAKIEHEDSKNATIALKHAIMRKKELYRPSTAELVKLLAKRNEEPEILSKEERDYLVRKNLMTKQQCEYLENLENLSEEEKEREIEKERKKREEKRKKQEIQAKITKCLFHTNGQKI
jgi:hypothetical protein